jgi:transglutaminase-like putative cysteine protease
MPRFKIHHITRYTYEGSVRDSANQIMLYPVADEFQEVVLHTLTVSGNPTIEKHTDYFNNKVGTFTHSQPHHELLIDSRLEVITRRKSLPEDVKTAEMQWQELERLRFQVPYIDFLKLETSDVMNEMRQIVKEIHDPSCSPLAAASKFCTYVCKNFIYKKGITTIDTTLDEIWKLKSGVCQDFALILLAMLRVVNVPARYVSGYICPHKNGMRGEGATHAWVEAYIPFYGWIGLDPTNDCLANENHVKLAVGKNFYDCSPVRGTYRGTSDHTLEVAVAVSYEDGKTGTSQAQQQEIHIEPATSSFSKNSYRRNQEMQQQQ